jgi:hypothetical protein
MATQQDGVVSSEQLRAVNVSNRAAAHRTQMGAMHRVHRGVYAVGHRSLGRTARLRAALLACGEGAAISHGTAAAFWGIHDRWPRLIDVTVRCEQGRKIDGIRCRRCRYPGADEILLRDGIACTTPARVLIDMAGSFGTPSLRRLVERAAVLKLLDFEALDRAMAKAKRRRGVRALRDILNEWRVEDGPSPDLRSDFEALVLPRLLAGGLPRPACNQALGVDGEVLTVDFLWRERRLVVETDGRETHATPVAFQRDRERDQHLVAAGYRVARVTWAQMRDEPERVVGRIARAVQSGA